MKINKKRKHRTITQSWQPSLTRFRPAPTQFPQYNPKQKRKYCTFKKYSRVVKITNVFYFMLTISWKKDCTLEVHVSAVWQQTNCSPAQFFCSQFTFLSEKYTFSWHIACTPSAVCQLLLVPFVCFQARLVHLDFLNMLVSCMLSSKLDTFQCCCFCPHKQFIVRVTHQYMDF